MSNNSVSKKKKIFKNIPQNIAAFFKNKVENSYIWNGDKAGKLKNIYKI